jgi:hypothetical protein
MREKLVWDIIYTFVTNKAGLTKGWSSKGGYYWIVYMCTCTYIHMYVLCTCVNVCVPASVPACVPVGTYVCVRDCLILVN